MYFWRWKYLAEAWEADPSLLHAWDRVILDLGGGDAAKGLRGFLLMTEAVGHPAVAWLENGVHEMLAEQGLDDGGSTDGCAAVHMRRSDNAVFSNRPVYSLKDMVDATKNNASFGSGEGRVLLLLSDVEIDEKELADAGLGGISSGGGNVSGAVMLRRYRGSVGRSYSDHFPTKNVTLEVVYLHAELELASKCSHLTYQQGAFAGLLWDKMCHAHGGWVTVRKGCLRLLFVMFAVGRMTLRVACLIWGCRAAMAG